MDETSGKASAQKGGLHPSWDVQERQAVLSRKFDFADYEDVRAFLDALADLSESEDYYPNLHFARTHVTVTIHAREERNLQEADFAFARKVDALLKQQQGG